MSQQVVVWARRIGWYLRPLASVRVHAWATWLPLLEWLAFKVDLDRSLWVPNWGTYVNRVLLWGAHEALFTVVLFVLAGAGIGEKGLRFLGQRWTLVPMGVAMAFRVALYPPEPLMDTFVQWSLNGTFGTLAIVSVDIILGVAIAIACRARLQARAESTQPIAGPMWPGMAFIGLVGVSSWLRPDLTGLAPGGPLGYFRWWFGAWMGNDYDARGVAELIRTILGIWVTGIPVLLLSRWMLKSCVRRDPAVSC